MKKIFIFFFFILFSTPVNSQAELSNLLKDGNKLIFIRHAYAPGNGDPSNFRLNDCSTQRNLNRKGIVQSKKIGLFFSTEKIAGTMVFVYFRSKNQNGILNVKKK